MCIRDSRISVRIAHQHGHAGIDDKTVHQRATFRQRRFFQFPGKRGRLFREIAVDNRRVGDRRGPGDKSIGQCAGRCQNGGSNQKNAQS